MQHPSYLVNNTQIFTRLHPLDLLVPRRPRLDAEPDSSNLNARAHGLHRADDPRLPTVTTANMGLSGCVLQIECSGHVGERQNGHPRYVDT